MTIKTPATFKALIIPDTRASLLGSDSTYTQADPVVGTPTKMSGQTSLTLDASGSVDVSEDIVIQAASSGGRGGAGFLWKNKGDAKYRGHNGATLVQSWRALAYFDGTGSPVEATDPQAVTLENGVIVLAFERQTTLFREVVTRKYTPLTDTWGSVTIVYQTTSTGATLNPTLVVLPSGRLLCFHWVIASGIYNIRAHFSANSGTTWAVASRGVLNETIDSGTYAVGRLRAVFSGIGIALAAEVDLGKIWQYYSTDLGASFTKLSDVLASSYTHDLVNLNGSLGLLTIVTAGNGSPKLRIVGSITEPFANAEVIAIPGGDWGHTGATDQDLASWVDDDGALFVVGRLVQSTDQIIGLWSPAPYTEWSYLGESATTIGGVKTGLIIDTTTASVYPRYLSATYAGGRAMLFHSWSASGSAFDNSIAVAALGGWSTVPMGSVDDSLDADKTGGFTACYFPYDLPNTGAAWVVVGGGTAALVSGELALLSGGGSNTKYYKKNPAGAFANGMLFAASVAVTAGGINTTPRAGVQLRVADGASEIKLEIRMTTTGFLVYDKIALATFGAAVAVDTTGGVDLLVHMNDTTASVYYRIASSGEDLEYIAGPTGTITKKTVGAAANNQIFFGRIASSAVTSMTVTSIQYTTGLYTTTPAAVTADQRGRAFPSYVAGGISADQTGVAYTGDIHNIPIEYDYALTRALPLASPPSPRIGWRSTDETEALIAVLFSNTKTDVTELGGDLLGVHLEGINWSAGTVQGYNGSAWVDLATIDTTTGFSSLVYDRVGNIIRPANVGLAGVWSDANEWAGSHFKMIAGIGGACRKIKTNSSGEFVLSGGRKRVSFTLEGVTGSETTGGALSNGEIWPSRATILIPLAGVDYSAIRIKITASQGTAEGYYEIGQVVIGPVLMLADSYSWGRSVETQTGTTLQTSPDRIDRASVDAPARRIIEFGWVDGVDQTDVGDIVATGAATVGALPIAAHGETVHAIEGALRASDGPRRALVYLPNVTRITAGNVATIVRREATVLVRALSDVRRDTVVGEELTTELARLSSVVLEEIV